MAAHVEGPIDASIETLNGSERSEIAFQASQSIAINDEVLLTAAIKELLRRANGRPITFEFDGDTVRIGIDSTEVADPAA
jgi:hypothetical protein